MKKILIIGDGEVSKHFINRIIDTHTSENIYYVVETKAKKYKNINSSRFKFYEFDPTSLYKLANLLKMEFAQAIIVMDSKMDVEHTIKNIRSIKKQLRIIVLNKWKLDNEDSNVVLINSNEILSSRLIDYLPNVPVIAQNVGIGEGEIMEVLVPFGSSFIYKHIGVIEQKEWRIVAIYRNRKLIMPNRRRMIQPNDLLLLVGDPTVLKSVYRAIKRELGQFPEPFGSNLYLYLDMDMLNFDTAEDFIKRAIFVHEKLGHTLIIRVVNPSDIEVVWMIKSYRSENIIVDINYTLGSLKESFFNDIKAYHAGLVIVSNEMFADNDTRNMLYEAQVPVIKIADKELSNVKDASIILGDNRDLEKISSTIFDVSEQMSLNIELYNYLNEHQEVKEQVIEHYYNLATIFSKSIKVIKENQNPIKKLKQKEHFIQIVPFTKKLTGKKIYSILSTDSERLYHKLDSNHQIFIPVQI
ncbi:MAG: TrkA C-terminal domain-containing protein [Sulfurimonas sp.]|uniref:COG3400 family protein n=1 Tax=Sulfurimonas sp. TaxID=2022749 RepID=UPI0025CB998E|nr:TrkA C-terminal domain-containing protein [Sulfurimonas sp.]MCK9453641.1 potassium transporter TrkA [Sulfurimonas sp.]